MTPHQIFTNAPGKRILLRFEKDEMEEAVRTICGSIPDAFRERTELNTCAMMSMAVASDESANGFHDLAVLCSRLILTAGKRSRFEGLLMLDISGLLNDDPEDENRLRALGEVLSIKDGLASKCVTVLFGPTTETELLRAADCLDFDGKMLVDEIELFHHQASLQALLEEENLCCEPKALELLQHAMTEIRDCKNFDSGRFLQSCAAKEGLITEESILSARNNPYSYFNRQKKMKVLTKERCRRMIGFQQEQEGSHNVL